MRINTPAKISITLVLALAGLPASTAVAEPQGDRARSLRSADQAESATLDFRRVSDLKGTGVTNAEGETVATVSDLIVERATGRVTHAIVRDGGVMGIGSDYVAIPFRQFAFDHSNGKIILRDAEEDVSRAAESGFRRGWVKIDDPSSDRFLRTIGDD